jgi:hypothetical protein
VTPTMVLSFCGSPPGTGSTSTSSSASGAVDISITPSPGQYEQLIADLERLRDAGAESNTQAILDAVHEEAEATGRVPPTTDERKPG